MKASVTWISTDYLLLLCRAQFMQDTSSVGFLHKPLCFESQYWKKKFQDKSMHGFFSYIADFIFIYFLSWGMSCTYSKLTIKIFESFNVLWFFSLTINFFFKPVTVKPQGNTPLESCETPCWYLNCPAPMLSPVKRLFLASRRFSRSFLSNFYNSHKVGTNTVITGGNLHHKICHSVPWQT